MRATPTLHEAMPLRASWCHTLLSGSLTLPTTVIMTYMASMASVVSTATVNKTAVHDIMDDGAEVRCYDPPGPTSACDPHCLGTPVWSEYQESYQSTCDPLCLGTPEWSVYQSHTSHTAHKTSWTTSIYQLWTSQDLRFSALRLYPEVQGALSLDGRVNAVPKAIMDFAASEDPVLFVEKDSHFNDSAKNRGQLMSHTNWMSCI